MTRSEPIRVARLSEDQMETAAEVLAAAYFNEPYAVAFEPDDRRRFDAWRRGFLPDVRYCFCHGEPQVALKARATVGVALWMPPNVDSRAPEEEREFGLDGLREIFGEAYTHFLPLERMLSTLRQESMGRPHWFLRVIGIDPSESYQQVGTILLRAILLRADEAKLPCYIETGSLRQLSLYQQLGFQTVIHEVEPASGIEFWTMSREPFRICNLEPR